MNLYLPHKGNLMIWVNTLLILILLITGFANAMVIIIIYFIETFVVGLIHILRLILAVKYGVDEFLGISKFKATLKIVSYFLATYGIALLIQSAFVFAIITFFPGDSHPPHQTEMNLLWWIGWTLVLISIIANLVWNFITEYVKTKEYQNTSAAKIHLAPMPRIVIQQVALIIGINLMAFFKLDSRVVAILLIVFSLGTNLYYSVKHELKSHKNQF